MNQGSTSSDPLNPHAGNASALGASDCKPLTCDKAMQCIDGVRNPLASAFEMNNLRNQLAHCEPCLQAIDIEIKIKTTITPSTSELPTADFRMRITETLASVDLSKLDISDF